MLLNWTVPGGGYSGLKVLPAPLGSPSVSTLVLEWMKLPDGSKNQLLPRSDLVTGRYGFRQTQRIEPLVAQR